MSRKSYEERLKGCKNPLLAKLFKIIIEKKSNLCVAVNFKTSEEIVKFVDKVGHLICILKIQSLRYQEENDPVGLLKLLYSKKKEHNFLLFEDLKFCDGEETIRSYASFYLKYVDLVTIIPDKSEGIFSAIEGAVKNLKLPDDEPRGFLTVCELSFKGSRPINESKLDELKQNQSDKFVGIIAQKMEIWDDCNKVKATPGVHMAKSSDGQTDQQWRHPATVIKDGADIIIVGRGIVAAPENEIVAVTQSYKEVAFQAYLDDLNN